LDIVLQKELERDAHSNFQAVSAIVSRLINESRRKNEEIKLVRMHLESLRWRQSQLEPRMSEIASKKQKPNLSIPTPSILTELRWTKRKTEKMRERSENEGERGNEAQPVM